MADTKYKDFLGDFIMEVNEIALDQGIWGNSDFDRGYIAGMKVIMKALEDEMITFGLMDNDNLPALIDVDDWFREGKGYTFPPEASD